MASLTPTCPKCGSLDVEVETSSILLTTEDEHNKAKCPNCGWEGTARETVAAFFSDQTMVWDINRLGSVLLGVLTQYAAGPMVQVFEFAGLVEPDDFDTKGRIISASVAAAIEAGFAEASAAHLDRLKARLDSGDVSEEEKALALAALERDNALE